MSESEPPPAGAEPGAPPEPPPPRLGGLLEIPKAAAGAFDRIAGGDHVSARAEADVLATSDDEAARAAGRLAQDAIRPDAWALRTAALAALFFLVVGWAALVPHGSVRVARRLLDAVAGGQEAGAQGLFTEEGWGQGGKRLVEEFSGQKGRAYERSRRARDVGFVMVSFPAEDGRFARRYLMFDGERIRAVRATRPRPPSKQ